MRAAMRCTAPINAPGPPPTMPRRSRRSLPCFLDSAGMFGLLSCRKPQHSPVGFLVRTGFCKIVERALGDLNDVPLDKRRALPRALLAALQAAFPFEHCPAIKTVLRQFGKDAAEIHLPVAQRPEAPRALHPRLVSAVDSLADTSRGWSARGASGRWATGKWISAASFPNWRSTVLMAGQCSNGNAA